jgi:hypothetical protein
MNSYKCEICNLTFNLKGNLKKHLATKKHHRKAQSGVSNTLYTCHYCPSIDNPNESFRTTYKGRFEEHCRSYKCRGCPWLNRINVTKRYLKNVNKVIDTIEKKLEKIDNDIHNNVCTYKDKEKTIDTLEHHEYLERKKQNRHITKINNCKALQLHFIYNKPTKYFLHNWIINSNTSYKKCIVQF